MSRRRLAFRIRVEGGKYVRVNVLDSRKEMLREMAARHGVATGSEYAVTISETGTGMIADLYFYWRGLRPSIIAHEASHAAWAIALETKRGLGPETEEFVAGWVDRITERVWVKTQTAPL